MGGPNASVVYRALRDIEANGWATSAWDTEQTQRPPRRVYRLTALGDEVLGLFMQGLRRTRTLIDRLVSAYGQHMEHGKGDYHG